jgi:hypothetical protein
MNRRPSASVNSNNNKLDPSSAPSSAFAKLGGLGGGKKNANLQAIMKASSSAASSTDSKGNLLFSFLSNESYLLSSILPFPCFV